MILLNSKKKKELLINENWWSIQKLQYIWSNEKIDNINYSNVIDFYKKISKSIPENILDNIPKYWEDNKKKNLTIRKRLAWKIVIWKNNKIWYIDTEEFKKRELDRFDLIEMLKQFISTKK